MQYFVTYGFNFSGSSVFFITCCTMLSTVIGAKSVPSFPPTMHAYNTGKALPSSRTFSHLTGSMPSMPTERNWG